ncbi:DUF4824 family protein [Marinomonas sp.]|uniref:DUF4824 family protein n=1 Tax=Marinomonas sp. TaxID=1904862 RepID=UPI003BA9B32B
MKKYIFYGLCIILGANALFLAQVYFNKQKVTSSITLTERELYVYSVDKGELAININRRENYDSSVATSRNAIFLNASKADDLGFLKWNDKSSRELFWAVEFDGDVFENEVEHQKEIHKPISSKRVSISNLEEHLRLISSKRAPEDLDRALHLLNADSHLFVLDLSESYKELANKYKDRKNIFIAKGLTRILRVMRYKVDNHLEYRMNNERLAIRNIKISPELMAKVADLSPWQKGMAPRYTVDVKWGANFEPWVTDIKRIDK